MSSNKQKNRQRWEHLKRRKARQNPPRGSGVVGRIPANQELMWRRYLKANTCAVPPKEYVDHPYVCVDCGHDCLWTASEQQHWFEVKRGSVRVRPNRCLDCLRRRKAGIAPVRDRAWILRNIRRAAGKLTLGELRKALACEVGAAASARRADIK